jgi:hypothetical protein
LIFFPLQKTARLSHVIELLGSIHATVAVPLGLLTALGSTPRPGLDITPANIQAGQDDSRT